jgi:Protein of unknown function (DUF1236)
MTNRFLISVAAAALIAGTGFANAQGAGTSHEAPSAGSTQSAPSSEHGGAASGTMKHDSGGATGMKGAESQGAKSSEKGSEPGMKASDSEKAQPGATKSTQDNMQGQKSKSMSSENETKGGKDMKADGHDQKGTTAQSREGQTGNMNAQTKGTADSKSGTAETKSQTTGNAATSATAAPPAEKRTQIVSAIKSEKIQETTNVNFNISVGAVIPTTVRFHPLPPRIVEIYPEWRGYDVILVSGRYIIVRPQTHEIVYIIEG